MKTVVDSASPTPRKKPLFALLLATGLGLGYLPKAPGTWGSLLGLGISWAFLRLWPHAGMLDSSVHPPGFTVPFLPVALLACLSVALVGVWAAGRAERYFGEKDPQKVLDAVKKSAIENLHGQLIREQAISHKNYPGREFFVEIHGGYTVRQRIFLAMVTSPPRRPGHADAARFFGSMTVGQVRK